MAINRIKTGGITDNTIQSGDLAPGTVANDRLANNTITINGTSIALGASGDIVAGTDWQAVTVADGSTTVNTVAGGGYLLDTNAGVIEAFLPTSPTRGDTVVIADYSGTFATNRCIVNTGGENIDSTVGTDFQLTTNNTIAEFIYIDSSKGWLVKLNQAAGTTPGTALGEGNIYDTDAEYIVATGGTVTEVGDYKVHSFTGDGCFVVSSLGNCAGGPNNVSYVVVAGGGAGGRGSNNGAGGGAGGYREGKDTPDPYTASPLATTGLPVSATTYPITVGGGAATNNSIAVGGSGSNSIFSTITSTGGGGGSKYPAGGNGGNGGSGGGAGDQASGGTGNSPPVSPPQGNPGSSGAPPGAQGQGAGGGASATGSPGLSNAGGDGGDGVGTAIGTPSGAPGPSPSLKYFAGGGGGGMSGGVSEGSGGIGGGGTGRINNGSGGAGSGNTGGGGGGNGPVNGVGGAGGSGIVVIRYKFQ